MNETPYVVRVTIQYAWLRMVPVYTFHPSIIINSASFHYQTCLRPKNYMVTLIIAVIKLFSNSSLTY